jgi:hypothetical protein
MATPYIGAPYVAANQNQKEVTINSASDALDAAMNASIIVDCTAGDVTLTGSQYTRNVGFLLQGTPAADFNLKVPNTKRAFIVTNDTGKIATVVALAGGNANALGDGLRGFYLNTGSNVLAVTVASAGGGGSLATDSDVLITAPADDDEMIYDASVSKWKNRRKTYIVGSSAMTGTLTNNQVLLYHQVTKDVTFPANFGAYLGHASQAGGDTSATGSTVITVSKASSGTGSFTDIGTITIGAGGVTATKATVGGTPKSLVQGEVLRFKGQASADATFANFFATLVAFET